MAQSTIKKGAIISYISIFLHIVISFVYTPWMIHQIGTSDYGLYTLVGSFISYFILDFGLSATITRFIAKYRAEGDQQKVENMLGLTTKVYLAIDGAILLLLTILYFFISKIFIGLTPIEIERLKVLYIISGGFSVLTFAFKPMAGAMMAYEYFVENKSLDMVRNVGTVLLVVIILFLGGGVYELIFINGFVAFFVSLMKYCIFKRKSKIKINWSFFDRSEMKALLLFSIWIFLIGIAQRFRLSLMPSILGIFKDTMEISIFSIGMMIEGMVYTLSTALNGLFLPKVSRMIQNSNDKSALTDLMIRVGRLQLYIISIIILGFLLVGHEFLILWVGEDFSKSYIVVRLLTSPNIVSLTQRIGDDVILVENKVRYTASYIFISSGLGLLVAILLANHYGAIGCAFATSLSLWAFLFLVNAFYKRKLHLEIGRFFTECHIRIIPLQVIVTIVFFCCKSFLVIDNWLSFFIFGTVYVLVMIAISYCFLFNKEEKKLFHF